MQLLDSHRFTALRRDASVHAPLFIGQCQCHSCPSRGRSSSVLARVEPRNRAPPLLYPRMATQPSLADPATIAGKALRGSTHAAAVSGPSRETSSSALARVEPRNRAPPSLCRATVTRPSLAALAITAGKALRGS